MFTRRIVSFGGFSAFASLLAGCAGSESFMPDASGPSGASASSVADAEAVGARPLTRTLARPDYKAVYNEYPGEKFPVLAFDYTQVPQRYLRQTVQFPWAEPVGSIVVDPRARHLYFVEEPGKATRYGVGVGRDGFLWSGEAQIQFKRDWPDWVPPREMVERDPDIKAELEPTPRGLGVRGGTRSPLGARAMYLFRDRQDLGYRIHGTTEPETIGSRVSSGCVRMVNQDIAHLYTRAQAGTHVTVLA